MINPKIKADLYLDRGENESELKQVCNDLDFYLCIGMNFIFSLYSW